MSDAGVADVERCKKPARLHLGGTKVTAAKIEELKKALPECEIEVGGAGEAK